MPENKFCTECGAPLGEGVGFCTACGAKVSNDSVNEPTESAEQVSQTNQEQNFSNPVNEPVIQQYNQTSDVQQQMNQQTMNQPSMNQQQTMDQQQMNPNMNQQPYNVPQYSSYPTAEQQKNNKSGKAIAAIIGVVAVAAAIFLVYKVFFSYPSKPEDVAVNFVEALMVDMDASETGKYVIEEVNDAGDIKEVINEFKGQGFKISNVRSTDVEKDGDTAEVTVEVKISLAGQSVTEEMTLELTKVSGKWKVSDFN